MSILEISNLSKAFKDGKDITPVLDGISLSINKGDIFGIIGLSGEGKSTLVRCINRLENATGGNIYFSDEDGTIDVVATDHAPHTAEEKSRGLEFSAMGVVGLETSFAVIYTKLVKQGIISLEKAIEVMAEAPRRIFGLGGGLREGEAADIAVFDLEKSFTVDPDTFLSMGRSTPFEGWQLQGECCLTLVDGKVAYEKR